MGNQLKIKNASITNKIKQNTKYLIIFALFFVLVILYLNHSSDDVLKLNQSDITKEDILNSALKGGSFLLRMQEKSGRFKYLYEPLTGTYLPADNGLRQAGAVYALTFLSNFTGDEKYSNASEKGLKYLLSLKEPLNNTFYISYTDYPKLGITGLTLLAITYSKNFSEYKEDAAALGDFILLMQNEDGSFRTNYPSPDVLKGIDYYPGEALYALVNLYGKTGDKRYLNSIENSFIYYREHFKNKKKLAFLQWQIQAFASVYKFTEDKKYSDFVFEMADWLLTLQYNEYSKNADFIGGFSLSGSPPTSNTASYLEGLSDAYKLAKILNDPQRAEKYRKSLILATRFVLKLQFNKKNNFYVKHPDFVVGGFRESLISNQMRVDYTQHGVLSLLKVYQVLN